MRQGETQVASCLFSGASATSCFLASALERAMSTASARRLPRRLRKIVGGGETPAAIGQHADSNADRFVARYLAGLAVLSGKLAVAAFDDADVGVSDARREGQVERFKRKLLHEYRIRGQKRAHSPMPRSHSYNRSSSIISTAACRPDPAR